MPWNPATPKTVQSVSSGTQVRAGHHASFSPPALPSSLTFSGLALFASVARANALIGAAPSTIQGLARSAGEIICAVVEDPPPLFWVTTDVDYSADAKRTSFSADIGAGITDLIMSGMGYTYRDNARSLIKTGRVGDFIYDGPRTYGAGVVLAEAKGSISSNTNLAHLQRIVRNGYRNQVAPHVDTSPNGVTILHGYAIGLGGKPGNHLSNIHIEEAARTPVSPHGGFAGGTTSTGSPQTQLVLGNYRALFGLLGAEQITSAIDAVRGGNSDTLPDHRDNVSQYLQQMTAEPIIDLLALGPRPSTTVLRLGIDQTIAESFLTQLLHLMSESRDNFQIPLLEGTSIGSRERVTFPDGLFAHIARESPRTVTPPPILPPPLHGQSTMRAQRYRNSTDEAEA